MAERIYKIEGCFIDDDKRFAFIHIYKNASIAIRNALEIRGKYAEWGEIKKFNPVTLCVIRNPYSRIISAYQYLFRLEDNGLLDQFPVEKTKKMKFFNTNDLKISFDLFLDELNESGFYDATTLPQVSFLSDRDLSIEEIDEIFVQERIEEDFNRFNTKYNLNKKLSRDNVGYNFDSSVLKNLILENYKIRKKIYSLYEEDIQMYNENSGLKKLTKENICE